MRKLFGWLAGIAIALGAVEVRGEETATAAETVAMPTAAVFAFESRGNTAARDELGASIAELLTVELMANAECEMVERDQLKTVMDELHISGSGLVAKDTQLEIGRLIGARILITGSVFRSGDKNYLVAKVIGSETSRVFGASVNGGADPAEMVPELAEKIAALINERVAELLPKRINGVAVAAQLSEVVAGNGRKVFVRVPEDINEKAPDPAVETALKKLLLELGFVVVADAGSADFQLVGEALATTTGSYRNLIGASARLELSLLDSSRKLLAIDSQVEKVAGASYAIAAKEALNQAALNAALRILPVLEKK